MAKFREYGYYPKGNKLGIVEKDQVIDTEVSTTDINAFKRNTGIWKSPLESVTGALQIEYAYNPKYFINEIDKVDTAIDTYLSLDGLLKLIDSASDDYSASPQNLADGSYIVLKKAGKWNGLHKVKDAGAGYVTLYTKFSGSSTAELFIEEASPELYYNVDPLNDEGDELNIPHFLELAVIDYVKAQISQDSLKIDGYEYFMKQFRKKLEQHENSRIYGPRMIIAGSHSVR